MTEYGMTEFALPVSEASYFMRRLAEVRRTTSLPASVAFDLARTSLTDDELENAVDAFGGQRASGWGLNDVLDSALSKEPQSIQVDDLKVLQENLIAHGYAAPGTEATGVWDSSWNGAFRRAEGNAYAEVMRGHAPTAAPLEAGIRMLTNVLPSRVWQGLVGTAKGFIEQAPETAERVGALGGAASGAALGATIGSVIPGAGTAAGAAVGAGIGAVTGFLADLLGEDEGEQDQSSWERIADALTPYEEYKDNPRAFFEDLGWVASAASMIAGAGLAAKGATAGINLARGIQAAEGGSLGGAFLARGAAAEPGWFSRITAATARPVLGPARVETMVSWVKLNGLRAQMGRPIFQLANGAYAGLSSGQLGARMAAGFGAGTSELDTEINSLTARLTEGLSQDEERIVREELAKLEARKAQTQATIEKSIDSTSPLPAYVDILGFVLVPGRFFPVRVRDIGNAAQRVLGSVEMAPIANIVQAENKSLSLREAVVRGRELLGRDAMEQAVTSTWLRRQFGIDLMAAEKIAEEGMTGAEMAAEGAFNKARAAVISALHKEVAEGKTGIAERVLRWSVDDPVRFEAWLVNKKIGRLPDYLDAEKLAARVTEDIRSGALPLEQSQIRGYIVSDAEAQFSRLTATNKISRLIEQADTLQRTAAKTTDLGISAKLHAEAKSLRVQVETLKRDLPTLSKIERTTENLIIVPERLDSLSSGELRGLSDEYLRLRQQVIANSKDGPTAASSLARVDLSKWVDDLARRFPIPEDIAKAAKTENPSAQLAEYLKKRAKTAAGEIQLSPSLMREFEALGYKPVATSGDVVLTQDMISMGEIMGAGDYTRRAAFWETIGLGLRKTPDESLFKLKEAHEVSELGQTMTELGIPLSGEQARAHLYARLSKLRREGVTKGPIHFPREGKLAGLPPVDIRDLSLEDVWLAFEDVPGFMDEAAEKVYGSLKRAAAYGAELNVRAPMDTMRGIGRALRLNGLPGFSDVIRTYKVNDPRNLAIATTVAGAGLGAVYGDEKLEDTLKGALGGAAVGLGLKAFAKGAYRYLPDRLVRLNTALRYSLSFTFDAGRYTEASSTMMARYELPGVIRPQRYVKARTWAKSPYRVGPVTGDEAWSDALHFLDDLSGTSYMRTIEDIDRRGSQVGLLGFNPREQESAYAFLMYQRGWGKKKILEAVSQVNRYGLGRAAVEKSANFIFFPFSFSKKYIMTLGDFMIQAPARALILHEGLRRYTESGIRGNVNNFLDQHVPLLRELSKINNLTAYGLSPGRFFLKGLDDNRTNVGKVLQILSSVFVPSGAATPLAQAAGGAGDFAIHAFIPQVLTGESIDRAGGIDGLEDLIRRYVPFVRELNDYFVEREGTIVGGAVGEQLTAIFEGAAPGRQYADYADQLREWKEDLKPIALAMGYASAEGLLNSKYGWPLKEKFAQFETELRAKYPSAGKMADEFETTSLVKRRAIADIAQKDDPSKAEEMVLRIAEEEWKYRMLIEVANLPSDLVNAMLARKIRELALTLRDDRRFRELWEYLYADTYGPISRVA